MSEQEKSKPELKPNPEQFASHLLWHLCALRSEVYHLSEFLIPLAAAQTGKAEDDLREDYTEEVNKLADLLHASALKNSGLPHYRTFRPNPGASPTK